MNKQLSVWKLIAKSLQSTTGVVLLYVLESSGSSPGRQGFFMVVTATGEMEGSIGGGIMEHKLVELAKEKLREGNRVPVIKKQIHDKLSANNQSGMICSGEQTILLYTVTAKDALVIQKMIITIEQNKNGSLLLSPDQFFFSPSIPAKNFQFSFISDDDWEYIEKVGYKNQLFIIGGGHCALAFSKLMRVMDFYITLFEEREELYTVVQNEFAHEVIIVDDYSALVNLISSGPNQYTVIMTVGYRSDSIALRALMDKKFSYLGMLGSKTKIKKLLGEFRKEGMAGDLLKKIHSPIGLAINSHTPEEIAISIAAEIINVKNGIAVH